MSAMPTRCSIAGVFQSKSGKDDFTQYVDVGGTPVYWVDRDGAAWGVDFFVDKNTSLRSLQQQINTIQFSGLPPVIDCGTF